MSPDRKESAQKEESAAPSVVSMRDVEKEVETPSPPGRWLPEFLELSRAQFRQQGRLLGACLVVGVVAGLAAVAFALACQLVVHYALERIAGYSAGAAAHEARIPGLSEETGTFRPVLLVLIPALGGILTGVLVSFLAPEAEGHGTDAAIAAYHYHHGYLRPRVPLVKLVASALTLGTGGSGGREGPIAQIGAGCGSVLGRLLRLPPPQRRILLAAGLGAGIAAIFRAPLAGALFAAEVLYRSPEFEAEVILPAGLSSVVAYCTFGLFFGWDPLFDTPAGLSFTSPWELLPYLLLAVAMALLAMLYTQTFYWMTYWFRRLPWPSWLKPAVGAGLSGALGLGLYALSMGNRQTLAVLSFGYGALQEALQTLGGGSPAAGGDLTVLVLALIALGKILTTSLTIGSGGSGGVFGPSMVIGGCGGAALGLFLHRLFPSWVPQPATFLIVGMAGFFAAAGKVPFSTILMVSELTGDYSLLLPALWVCTLAYLLSDRLSLYQSQVEDRWHSPVHQGRWLRTLLSGWRVAQVMTPLAELPLLHPQDPLPRISDCLSQSTFPVLPVVDEENRLLGVVVLEEVFLAWQAPHAGSWLLAADLLHSPVTPLRPDDSLDRAQELFVTQDLWALPVVEPDSQQVLGMVRRSEVARTYLRQLHGQRTQQAGAAGSAGASPNK